MKIKDMSSTLTGLINQQQQTGLPSISQTPLSSMDESIPSELAEAPVFSMNYKSELKQSIRKAKDSIILIVKEIVPASMQKSPLIIDKIQQDAEVLGDLYYQKKKKEAVHLAAMDRIARGDGNMKLFEMVEKMSNSIAELSLKINDKQNEFRKFYIDTYQDMQTKEDQDEMLAEWRDKKQNAIAAGVAAKNSITAAPEQQTTEVKNVVVGTEDTVRALSEKKKRASMEKYKAAEIQ